MNERSITDDVLEFSQQYVEFLKEQLMVPAEIARKYHPVSLLSESRRSQVFLIADGDTQYVLKIYDTPDAAQDEPILKQLDHPGIPKLIEMHRAGGKTYLVREYCKGVTLAKYIETKGTLTGRETRDIALQICDVLRYLHSRRKPVIHRDIKAENIVITPDHRIALIDFDIAREFDDAAASDTVYYGTREYSPPEQFGFAQTDARTDIYSLGVLMLLMLTGSKNRDSVSKIKDPRYRRVVETCMSFAPSGRYSDADALEKALRRAGHEPRHISLRIAVIIACAAVLIGFGAGLLTANQSGDAEMSADGQQQAEFQSQLIEQAVRLMLGKESDELVYVSELRQITSLHICGTQVYDGSQRLLLDYVSGQEEQMLYFDSYQGESVTIVRGSINTLEDLRLMTNLKILDVMYQNITDLSPLEGLPIERLQVAGNTISDLTPLKSLPLLVYLNIDGNPVMDITPLASLTRLTVLDASETYIYDVAPLKDLADLESLYMNNAKLTDISALENLTLNQCYLTGNDITDYAAVEDALDLHTDVNP